MKTMESLINCWKEYKMILPFWKTVRQFLKKLNIVFPCYTSTAFSGDTQLIWKFVSTQKLAHDVYNNFIHNWKKGNVQFVVVEFANGIPPYKEIFSSKKEMIYQAMKKYWWTFNVKYYLKEATLKGYALYDFNCTIF